MLRLFATLESASEIKVNIFSNRLYIHKIMKKRLVYIFLFLLGTTQAQWNPAAPFYTPAEDCPVAMRICDATQEYNFELVGDGDIDDANGSLDLIVLARNYFYYNLNQEFLG